MAKAMKLALVLALATAFGAATAQPFTLDIAGELEELQPVQSMELMHPQPIGPPNSPIETDWTLFRPQQQQLGARPQPGGSVRPRPQQPQPQLQPQFRPQQAPSGIGSTADKDIVDPRPIPRPQPNEEVPFPMPGAFMQLPAQQRPQAQYDLEEQLKEAADLEPNLGHAQNSHVYPGAFKKEPVDMVNGVEVPKPKYPHGARP